MFCQWVHEFVSAPCWKHCTGFDETLKFDASSRLWCNCSFNITQILVPIDFEKNRNLIILFLSLSVPVSFMGLFLRLWSFFYSIVLSCFGVGLPAYLAIKVHFWGSLFFVGFIKFTSLVCWCTATEAYSFWRAKWDFTCVQYNVCLDMGPPV